MAKDKILKILKKTQIGTKLYSSAFGKTIFNGIFHIFDEEKIESYGSNSYPPTFREFIKAVEQLTGLLIEFIHEE